MFITKDDLENITWGVVKSFHPVGKVGFVAEIENIPDEINVYSCTVTFGDKFTQYIPATKEMYTYTKEMPKSLEEFITAWNSIEDWSVEVS